MEKLSYSDDIPDEVIKMGKDCLDIADTVADYPTVKVYIAELIECLDK